MRGTVRIFCITASQQVWKPAIIRKLLEVDPHGSRNPISPPPNPKKFNCNKFFCLPSKITVKGNNKNRPCEPPPPNNSLKLFGEGGTFSKCLQRAHEKKKYEPWKHQNWTQLITMLLLPSTQGTTNFILCPFDDMSLRVNIMTRAYGNTSYQTRSSINCNVLSSPLPPKGTATSFQTSPWGPSVRC